MQSLVRCMPLVMFSMILLLGPGRIGNAAETGMLIPDISKTRILEGSADVSYSDESYRSPGIITLADLKGRRALVQIGNEMGVEGGRTYYLSAWIRTVSSESRGRTQLRTVVSWKDGSGKELETLESPWAIADYGWMEYGDAGVAPKEAASCVICLEYMFSSLGPPPPGFRPVTFAVNNVMLARTPRVEVSTGRRGNIIFEGEPLRIALNIDDSPEHFGRSEVQGTVLDYWRNPVERFAVEIGEGSVEKEFIFAGLPRGYYSVEWTLRRDGRRMRDGMLAAAIVPSLHARIPDRVVPFAVDAGLSAPVDGKPEITMNEGSYMAMCAGVHTLRERPGPKERMLRAAKTQQEAGIDPYHILSQSFRNCLRNSGASDSSSGDLFLMEVYNGTRQLTAEFGDLLRFWEVWNEPDIFFFPGRAEEFAAISKAAYLGAYAGNPNARVLLGSLAHVAGDWYEDVMKNGYKDYFDIFNMHYYIKPIGVVDRIRSNRAFMRKFGFIDKPIWLTELGFYNYKDNDGTWWRSEKEQAIHAVRAACHSVAEGVDKFFIFYLQEFLENSWAVWGITRRNWTPKPAYAAYANMTYMLGRGRYIGYFDTGLPSGYAYVFDNGKTPVTVMWAEEEGTIKLPGDNLAAWDIMGAPVSPDKISRYPVYVTGADLSSLSFHPLDWGTPVYEAPDLEALATILSLRGIREKDAPLYPEFRSRDRKDPLVYSPGEIIELEFKVCNLSANGKSLTCAWDVPEGWQILDDARNEVYASPWSEQNIRIRIKPVNAAAGAYYEMAVNAQAEGRTISPAYLRIKMQD